MQRVEWIDAAKGVGIALIVVGHVWSLHDPPLAYQWLYAFHVPLFFFLAGVALKPTGHSLPQFAAVRARALLVPYLWYGLLGYLFYVAGYVVASSLGRRLDEFDYGFLRPLFGILHGTVGDGYLVNSPLWFLPALFLALLFWQLVARVLDAAWARWALVAGLMALGLALGDTVRLPFSLVAALIAVGFVHAGHVFRTRFGTAVVAPRLRWLLLVPLVLISLAAPLNGMPGVADGRVGQPALFIGFALNGILMCVLLVQSLPARLRALFARIGRHSLEILVIHMLVIKGVKVVLNGVLGVSLAEMEQDLLLGVLILASACVLMLPTVLVMARWLPWTLGRGAPAGGSRP
jgi:acyltransferase